MDEKFTYFWGDSPFSQWAPAIFKVNCIVYNCAEQYMMASKARLFNDEETLIKIMDAKQPREQKKLGRQVSGFEVDKWNIVAKNVVYAGNYAKFTQNSDMLAKLMATKDTTLVEASPYDKIWGIGMNEFEAKKVGRSGWRGFNWLGEVLTKLRNDLESKLNNDEDY